MSGGPNLDRGSQFTDPRDFIIMRVHGTFAHPTGDVLAMSFMKLAKSAYLKVYHDLAWSVFEIVVQRSYWGAIVILAIDPGW